MLQVVPTPPDARLFAALGDPVRLALIERLRRDGALPITRLSEGTGVTRQATTKHLVVLAAAGLVRPNRVGREVRYTLSPSPLRGVADWAATIFAENEARLGRHGTYLESTYPTDQGGEHGR